MLNEAKLEYFFSVVRDHFYSQDIWDILTDNLHSLAFPKHLLSEDLPATFPRLVHQTKSLLYIIDPAADGLKHNEELLCYRLRPWDFVI